MILKVAIPGKMQFKMIRREPSFLLSGQGDIHYIGGAEVLPADAVHRIQGGHGLLKNH